MSDWHVSEDVWRAYASGGLDTPGEASVEAHVVRCPQCREAAKVHAQPPLAAPVAATVWEAVRATVTAPAVPWQVRWLRRFGVPERELVLLAAADAVMLPWVTAVGSALVVVLLSAFSGWRHDVVFVALAPLVPVLSVAAALDATESLREVSAATPYPTLRLVLLRVTAALAVALPVTTAIGLAVPQLQSLAGVWLLPGLALTVTALVLLSWLPPWRAGGAVAGAWLVAAAAAERADRFDLLTRDVTQLVFLVGAVVGVVVLVRRGVGLRSSGVL